MNEYSPSASVPGLQIYSKAEPIPARPKTMETPKRSAAKTKLSPYEWFFGMFLVTLVGVPLCFELYHLNPTPREIVTSEIRRLGGRIQFLGDEVAPKVMIDFTGIPIVNDDLACLQRLAAVERLDLSGTSVTDAGLVYVDELESLNDLDLSRTAVTDGGLSALRGVCGLKRLSLTSTRVTDAGIEQLSGLPELRELNVEHTSVGDAGLRRMAECKSLKTLKVGHTLVSTEAVAALRAARADLQIVP